LPIGIRGDGARLLVKVADVFNLLASAYGIDKMHAPAAGNHKDMLNLLRDALDNVIRQLDPFFS
jgi:Flp pilus assembly CpaE family ATPase